MARRSTDVCHQFFEFLIIASWTGYRVMQFRDEQTLTESLRFNLPDHLIHVQDWHQFRMQAPCNVPEDIADAIVNHYKLADKML